MEVRTPRRAAGEGVRLAVAVVGAVWLLDGPLRAHSVLVTIAVLGVALVAVLAVLRAGSAHRHVRHLALALDHARTHDPLTGLLTRDALLDTALVEGWRHELMLVRLEGVDLAREALGDAAADTMVVAAATRVRGLFASAPVARWGSTDVAVLLAPGAFPDAAARVSSALANPVPVEDRWRRLRPVVAVLPLTVSDPTHVRDDARAAVETASAGAPSDPTVVWCSTLRTQARDRSRLRRDLEEAITGGDLQVAFQPIVEVRTSRPVAVETLARWDHGERGPVPPAHFVALAERHRLAGALGEHVLDLALREAARWRAGGVDLPVSVNVSVRQLETARFPATVADALTRHGVPPTAVVLEVTESVLAADMRAARAGLDALRALGVRVALDDFGTGYCSLAYLHQYPADVLKIDRGLVAGAACDAQRPALLRAIVGMADALGLVVTAEGVESRDDAALLADLGIPHGQGFWYGRPMSPASLTTWLGGQASSTLP